MMNRLNKKSFYPIAREALEQVGFAFYSGDDDIKGKTRRHAGKPDYVAFKDNLVVIGEIKSPREGPKSSSWRRPQKSDTPEFRGIRLEIAKREQAGEILKEIAGHEIIIRGQIPDYAAKLGITFDLPPGIKNYTAIQAGYTVPSSEKMNVAEALLGAKKSIYEVIDTGNGSTTFIFPLK
jgi:hypothetical protein